MNLERLLAEQGRDPLTDKVNGVPLRALINATFKRLGLAPIDQTTPSEVILETIYGIEDETTRTNLLGKAVAEVKGSLNYKRLLAITALVATLATCGFFAWVVKGDTPLTAEEVDLIKTIGSGAFDFLKMFFGSDASQ